MSSRPLSSAPAAAAAPADQLAYWRRALAGIAPLDLPTDFARPPVFSSRGGRLDRRLDPLAINGLRRLSSEAGAPLAAGLLAAIAAVLHRVTGQPLVPLGVPANAELAPVAGGNQLALPLAVDGDQGFAALLADAAALLQAGLAHPDVPFELLADHFDPGRDPSRHSLFQASFQRGAPATEPMAERDLDFFVAEDGEAVTVALVFAADLFGEAKIGRLLDALEALLAAAVAAPQRPLHRLPLLPAAAEEKLRAGHGSAPLVYPRDLLLHDTFFRQAAATPDRIALRSGATSLTFAETAAFAARVARALQAAGAGPEARVGIFLERDHQLVACLLGTLAAGAAYVPLDPEYPAERIGFTLDDADARLILTQRALQRRLPPTSARVLLLEELDLHGGPAGPPPCAAVQDNLAYLIYTSGSTGRPKGVAIPHRSAIAFLEWTRQVFTEEELECVLFSTSICFDISIFEMFATLQRGGAVAVAKNAFELPHLPCRDQITLIDTVPSVTRELLRDGRLPPRVVTVNLAGEALPQDLVDRCWQEPAVRRVYNFYGPSEDTTFSTFEMCRPGLPPTIGRLIAGSRGFVVDRRLELLPPGFPGELFLAGEGLSRGYLGRPRLTAERYLPDPFSGVPGARIYRTGDLIRHREDGGFDFCGRLDHQVKVRGYRVELGEIENALREHPAVAQAVVLAREGGPGGLRLVSYVVPQPGAGADGEELRAFLAQRLPPFMVPPVTVQLGAFPLTPNGKVDRKALPPPEAAGAVRRDFRPPASPAELALAALWGELLGQEEIGLDDDFFQLGGDSILVVQVVARAYAAGWDLEPRELFAASTLAEAAALARRVDSAGALPEELEMGQDELADVFAELDGRD